MFIYITESKESHLILSEVGRRDNDTNNVTGKSFAWHQFLPQKTPSFQYHCNVNIKYNNATMPTF